jgi:hypothetical protein
MSLIIVTPEAAAALAMCGAAAGAYARANE